MYEYPPILYSPLSKQKLNRQLSACNINETSLISAAIETEIIDEIHTNSNAKLNESNLEETSALYLQKLD